MKANKVLLLSLAMFAIGANAASISVDKAKLAAGAWARSDASLGVRHGVSVSKATEHEVNGTPGFYAVSLEGGGTVFLAADDEIGPVIAFTEASKPDLSQGSYLRTMLEKDIAARRVILARSASQAKLTSSSKAAASPAKKMWAALVSSETSSNSKLTKASAPPREADAVSDMRVEPLVKSQWSQQEAGGGYCYNYYTPSHDPCGCTATAAAQIMRYFNYPDHELPSITRRCEVDSRPTDLTSVGDSRVYDWANMKLVPKGNATATEREAIGRLTYDVGVAVYSSYTASGTGADPQSLGELYQDAFDYASGVMYWNETGWNTGEGGLHTRALRNKIIYANLDAGRPVQLAIYFDGHSVVCDGYGFVTLGGEETEFAHINMGWAGTDDMWYNIPEINAGKSGAHVGDSGMVFDFIGGAQFNIHPTERGDILSGRVVDDGDPVSGVTVTVAASGSTDVLATTTTDAHGIYSFILPGGATYDVTATYDDGTRVKTGIAPGINLQATVEDVGGGFVHNVTQESRVGNSWGNDIDIVIPYVRIDTTLYPNLNTALVAASTMDDPVIEIFGPTRLKEPVTITTNITVCVVTDPASEHPEIGDCTVTINDEAITSAGWSLQVADGVRVTFSNTVFTVEGDATTPMVDVLEGGTLAIAGTIGLGTVATVNEDAFVLAGAFEPMGHGVSVALPEATVRFSRFGRYECSEEVAAGCAGKISNAFDLTLAGAVGEGGTLVWDRLSVDPSVALAYATNDVIGTTYYRSLDVLFSDYTNGAEVVLLRDCPSDMFSNSVVVAESLTVRSGGDVPYVVAAARDVGFTITAGDAALVFTNIVFTRDSSVRSTLDFVRVENGGSLTLASGAAIVDLKLAGKASAVYVADGSVAMQDGSAIMNCVATRQAGGSGAAIYLKGVATNVVTDVVQVSSDPAVFTSVVSTNVNSCTFDFAGGSITGCVAGQSGGGVYAGIGATVSVSGTASAYSNSAKGKASNVYVSSPSSLVLAGGLSGGSIGVSCYGGTLKGSAFATVGDGVATGLSPSHFSNDSKANLFASVSDDGAMLVWAEEPPGPKPVPEDEAEARIVADGSTASYATISNAFEAAALHGAKAIELLKDASISSSLSVVSDMVLDGRGFKLDRAGDYCISVKDAEASLTLTNIVFDGGTGGGRILDVAGGSLVLGADTVISGVTGSAKTMVAPIVVWNGSFTMNPGSAISGCTNSYVPQPGDALSAGAVLVTGLRASADLRGGSVTGCSAARAGGINISNGAQVRVSGDFSIEGNALANGRDSNLVVQNSSALVLDGELTGSVGFSYGFYGFAGNGEDKVSGDTNTDVFGTVGDSYASAVKLADVAAAAGRFRNDVTGAVGVFAKSGNERLLIWSTACEDGSAAVYADDESGEEYAVVADPAAVSRALDEYETVACQPFTVMALDTVSPLKMRLVVKPGTVYCTYVLQTSSDLATWTDVPGTRRVLAEKDLDADGGFTFLVDKSAVSKFWKVVGEDGRKRKE